MDRHDKSTKERKAKSREEREAKAAEEKKLLEASNDGAGMEPSSASPPAEASNKSCKGGRQNKAYHERKAEAKEEREAKTREGYGHQASVSPVDDFTRINSLGRFLSFALRHRAVELGLNMRSDGYVLVQDLLNLCSGTYAGLPLSSYTVDDIKEAVRTDNKQRFGLQEENGQLLIRANDGHSIQTIKSEYLLSPVYSPEEVPAMGRINKAYKECKAKGRDEIEAKVREVCGHQASASRENNFTSIDSLGRLLSSILRHRAVELGLNMRSDGYVLVQDLLNLHLTACAGLPLSSHTVNDIKKVVRTDNKQRFGLREENGRLLIRANEGHSIQAIESEDLLSRVYSPEEVPVCVHGTYFKYLDAIRKEGLKRMNRLHVHFATGLFMEKGKQSSCEVLIHLNVQKYLKDGMKLFRAENGVILAEGKNGVIPPNYFAKIERVRR